MEELQTSNRKRVYSLKPHATLRATFSRNYLNYLLPALLKLSSSESQHPDEGQTKEKIVRFHVDMALAMSASGFFWSQALKQKLELNLECIHKPTSLQLLRCKPQELVSPLLPSIPRPFLLLDCGRASCNSIPESQNSRMIEVCTRKPMKRMRDGDEGEEVGRRLRTLRGILPGGCEMRGRDLLSELQSYVVCLELQVHILKTLVNA